METSTTIIFIPSWNQLGTKYRDIADGNITCAGICIFKLLVGNQVPRYSGWKLHIFYSSLNLGGLVGNQVPRYSGWKLLMQSRSIRGCQPVGNQVPRYSGWKRKKIPGRTRNFATLETKYRDIAATNQLPREGHSFLLGNLLARRLIK